MFLNLGSSAFCTFPLEFGIMDFQTWIDDSDEGLSQISMHSRKESDEHGDAITFSDLNADTSDIDVFTDGQDENALNVNTSETSCCSRNCLKRLQTNSRFFSFTRQFQDSPKSLQDEILWDMLCRLERSKAWSHTRC